MRRRWKKVSANRTNVNSEIQSEQKPIETMKSEIETEGDREKGLVKSGNVNGAQNKSKMRSKRNTQHAGGSIAG